MAITTKELSKQLEEVTARLRAIESGQHVMTSSPGLPLDKWNDHGFVHRHEIKPLVRAINNGGGSSGELEERVEQLESGQNVLTSVTNQQSYEIEVLESGQAVLTSAMRNKQDTLIPGSGIDITENVISATGGDNESIWEKFNTFFFNATESTDQVLATDDNGSKYFGYVVVYTSRSIAAGADLDVSSIRNNPDGLNYNHLDLMDSKIFVAGSDSKYMTMPGYIDSARTIYFNQLAMSPRSNQIVMYINIKNNSSASYTVPTIKCGMLIKAYV